MTEASRQALDMLRDTSHFDWTLIPLLSFVFYAYFVEIERKNWNLVLGALTVWGVEVWLEIVNALVLTVTGYSAVWTEVGPTSFLILVGVNIETTFMFAVMGLVFCRLLPPDPATKILGVPSRFFLTTLYSCFCVAIEVVLNQIGVLAWAYWWWSWPHIWLIILFGYSLYFVASFYVMDLASLRKKVTIVATIWSTAVVAGGVCMAMGWI